MRLRLFSPCCSATCYHGVTLRPGSLPSPFDHRRERSAGRCMTTAQTATFAALLRRYRREAGLTQEALAERASISLRAISDLERGVYRTPHRDTVQLVAEALGLSPHDAALLEAAVVRGRGPGAAADALTDRL